MINTVEFSEMSTFIGRNGMFKAKAVELFNTDEAIYITPITSKNEQGRCEIRIPKKDIQSFIFSLQDIVKDHYKVKISDGVYLHNGINILTYTRGEAIKKAQMFKGKIEKV